MSHLGVCSMPHELSSLGFRNQRSSSDAGELVASRAHARATAAASGQGRHSPSSRQASRLSPWKGQGRNRHISVASDQRGLTLGFAGGSECKSGPLQRHRSCSEHHRCTHPQQHHWSHSCIPTQGIQDSNDSLRLAVIPSNKRSHSHSAVFQLGSKEELSGRDRQPSPGSSRSRGLSPEKEEATYVWKDGRVQMHHARGGMTTSDAFSSGQHVHYVWHNGNVERVVTGSNNELLSAEVVPPRIVKGGNCCVVVTLIIFLVSFAAAIIVVFRLLY